MKTILYVILHGSINKNRYNNIKETWGNNIDTLFYSDYEELDKNIIKVSNNNDYNSNEEKHINALKYTSNNTHYEWYFFCDDDTFVNTKKLETSLETFNKNTVNGLVCNCWQPDRNLYYCSGGAGYLIHHKLLNTIAQNIQILNTGFSDVTLGIHLKNSNIGTTNYDLFRSQPPAAFNYNNSDIKNYISFHYIKTKEEINLLLDNI